MLLRLEKKVVLFSLALLSRPVNADLLLVSCPQVVHQRRWHDTRGLRGAVKAILRDLHLALISFQVGHVQLPESDAKDALEPMTAGHTLLLPSQGIHFLGKPFLLHDAVGCICKSHVSYLDSFNYCIILSLQSDIT